MKKQLIVAATTGLLTLSFNAQAQEISYSYAEGGLAMYPGVSGQTPIGIDARASFDLGETTGVENLFTYGGFKYLTDNYDYTNFYVGAGYAHSLDAQTSIWGGGNIEYQNFDVGYFSHSDTSIALRGGVRHQLNQDLEVGGNLRLVTGDWDYLGLTGTARYQLQDNLYALGEIDIWDGDLGFFGGVGLTF